MNPRSYQDLAPPAFMPKMNNPIRRRIEIKYKIKELSFKNLLFVNNIIKSNIIEIKTKTTCFPIGKDKSKKEIKLSL